MKNQVLVIYFLIILVSTRVSSQVTPRYGHTAALVNSKLYIIGGAQYLGSTPFNETWMLDLSTPLNTTSPPWQNIMAMGVPQTAWGTACAVRNTIYLFGGNTQVNSQQSVSSLF